MDQIQNKFNICGKLIKKSGFEMTNDELLTLYGLYKQATIGNCDTQKPSGILSPKDFAKWNAWNSNKNINKYDAMTSYSKYVENLVKKYDSKN
jgi:diazepam-binding inhibitor (GABA receptor modulating acyl-CoA-binding protein)